MNLTTSYKILGLELQADEIKAKRAYKAQVRRWHPDQFPEGSSLKAAAEEQLKQINIAYAKVKANLALHRPDPGHTATEAPPPPPPEGHKQPPRQTPKRSWVDHLFDALNAFAGNRADNPQAASDNQADTKQNRTFEQVLDEMTGGVNPSSRRSGKSDHHAGHRFAAAYRQYRRQGSRVGGVAPTESKGPVKPVSRVRGIGRSR